MLNVLKSKIRILEECRFILDFFSLKSYVLDHSESIDMHIEKIIKKSSVPTPKNRGWGQNFGEMSATNRRFFIDAFPIAVRKNVFGRKNKFVLREVPSLAFGHK